MFRARGTDTTDEESEKDTGSTRPVRYRGPNGETWSRRGRKPRWLEELEAAGHEKEEYRVAEG